MEVTIKIKEKFIPLGSWKQLKDKVYHYLYWNKDRELAYTPNAMMKERGSILTGNLDQDYNDIITGVEDTISNGLSWFRKGPIDIYIINSDRGLFALGIDELDDGYWESILSMQIWKPRAPWYTDIIINISEDNFMNNVYNIIKKLVSIELITDADEFYDHLKKYGKFPVYIDKIIEVSCRVESNGDNLQIVITVSGVHRIKEMQIIKPLWNKSQKKRMIEAVLQLVEVLS